MTSKHFNQKEVKKDRFTLVYEYIQKGFNPTQISQRLNISKQNLNRYIARLKAEGYIKKIGYGLWQTTSKHLTEQSNTHPKLIRGHAFIWKVRFNKYIDWLNLLTKNQVNYDEIGVYLTPRVIINNKKIWLGKKNIVIYFNKNDSFFGFNSIESKKLAVYNLLDTIRQLENTFKTNLGNFKFTCPREHFSLINNSLAIQCDKEGKSILIRNLEGYWMSIDNSLNLHEAEAIGKDSMLDIEGIKKYFNSHKETKFKVTPEYTLQAINGLVQTQVMFEENLKSHIQAIKDISSAINELKNTIKELKK